MASSTESYAPLDGGQEELPTYSSGLLMYAPEKSPGPWAAINVGVLSWSIAMLVIIIMDSGRRDEFRSQLYLLWSFATTFVWVLEVFLSVWYQGRHSSWREAAELVLAAYLTYESAVTMWRHWCYPDKEVEGEVIDVSLTVAGYLYASEETCFLTWRQWRRVFPCRAEGEGVADKFDLASE
ncbi:unnamed protein product [Symbiodinium pilosum]|uniref:Uncharacterized protein n=1 Tax=Symbiodinium pilosum TaxID=2952 RepID=A0A812JG56_SYMPI|nr:unnamed protein product [Symbiodinium pilosum]